VERVEESPVRGGMAPRKYLVSPLAGLLKDETISYPSAVARGYLIAALKGLAGANPRHVGVSVFVKSGTKQAAEETSRSTAIPSRATDFFRAVGRSWILQCH
jgi:hypothetical protein